MPKSPIDKLEELIPRLVEEARQLREDNQRLQKEVAAYRADLDRSQKEGAKLQDKVQRLSELESVQKRLEKDQLKIRSTVESLLSGNEKIGLS